MDQQIELLNKGWQEIFNEIELHIGQPQDVSANESSQVMDDSQKTSSKVSMNIP